MSREGIVAEALSWLGTPYAHRQRLKGVGVDCAQLPFAVYRACGLLGEGELDPYPAQGHLHRGEELYVDEVVRLGGREVASARPGDLLLWRYGRTFSHGGLVLEGGRVIHARRGRGVVVDDIARDEELRSRPVRTFALLLRPSRREQARSSA